MKRPRYRIVVMDSGWFWVELLTDIGHFWAPVGGAHATREDAEKFIADRGGQRL